MYTTRTSYGPNGFVAVGVMRDGTMVAAVTRTATGASWTVDRTSKPHSRGEQFESYKAAMKVARS